MVGGAQKSSSTSAEGQRLLDGLAMGTKVLFHPNTFTSSAKKEKRQKVMRQPMSILANQVCTLQHYPIPADGSKKLKQSKKYNSDVDKIIFI